MKKETVKKQDHKPEKRQPFVLRGAFVAAFVAALVGVAFVVALGFSYERAFAGKLYPGVRVLGIPMGGMNLADGLRLANERAASLLDQQITIAFPDATSHVVTPRELGLTLDPDGLLREAYGRGRTGDTLNRWSELALLAGNGAVYAFSPVFDTDAILGALEPKFQAFESAAVDAKLVLASSELTIEPAKQGKVVDRKAVSAELEQAFRSLVFPAAVTVPVTVSEPTISTVALEPLLADAKRLTGAPITLTAGEQTFTATSKTQIRWVLATTEGTPTLTWNQDEIESYVASLAKKTDRTMRPRKLNSRDQSVLDAGEEGKKLDQINGTQQVVGVMAGRQAQSSIVPIVAAAITLALNPIPITEQTVIPPFTPGLYEGKYIEVNLKEQQMYQWEGTNLVATYTVSTGKWNTPTPEGTLYVKNHIPYAYSRKFDLYMPWWLGLSFNPDGSNYQGYGIHELPEWKNGYKEGQGHLGTAVSHGCVRLGIGPAEAIYNWAEEGMPVYIHR